MVNLTFKEATAVTSIRHLLVNHDVHPLILRKLLTRRYADDWLTWDPSALWLQINRDFGVNISELSKTKIQALRTLSRDYRFWTEWEIFYPVVQSLNNRIPNFWLIQKPTVPQLYVTVNIAKHINGRPYDREIRKFMAAAFLDAGLFYAPPPLDFIQNELDSPQYYCNNCGQKAEDDDNRECDHCGSRDIKKFKARDSSLIGPKIQSILANGYDILDENLVGVHAANLLVALNYMRMKQDQLKQQLSIIEGSNA